jgi:HAD superfamily hydrolase (TIGR01549 family)
MSSLPLAVLFDIDGTLTDTNYLHVRAWRLAFAACGLPEVTSARIHRMIGAGSGRLLRELAGEERDDVKDAWRREFDRLKPEIAAFPKAADLLKTVADAGVTVVLATSSEPEDVDALVEAIGASDAVSAITSAGDVDEAKPEPDVFEVALEKAGASAADALVVGDSVWDVEAASKAGLATVAVRCGGISGDELRVAGAVEVFDDPAALLASLERWLVLPSERLRR